MIGKLKSITMMLGCLVVGAVMVGLLYFEYREVEILKEKSRYISDDKHYPLRAFDFSEDAQYIISNPKDGMCDVETYEIVTNQEMIKENIDNFYIDYNTRANDTTMCGTIHIYENGEVVHADYENGKGTYSLIEYGTLQFESINKEQYSLLLKNPFRIEFGENHTLTGYMIEGVLVVTVHVHGETPEGVITTHEVTTYIYGSEKVVINELKGGILEIEKYGEKGDTTNSWSFNIKNDKLTKLK